jgi:hypothetical protein
MAADETAVTKPGKTAPIMGQSIKSDPHVAEIYSIGKLMDDNSVLGARLRL